MIQKFQIGQTNPREISPPTLNTGTAGVVLASSFKDSGRLHSEFSILPRLVHRNLRQAFGAFGDWK